MSLNIFLLDVFHFVFYSLVYCSTFRISLKSLPSDRFFSSKIKPKKEQNLRRKFVKIASLFSINKQVFPIFYFILTVIKRYEMLDICCI